MNYLPLSIVIFTYILFFAFGAVIGSFLNVCCMRIPLKENFVVKRSHCDSCGYELKWYDLVPIFSFLFLGGRCRKCKAKIPVRHLLMEVANGLLYTIVLFVCELSVDSLVYCFTGSALLALSVIDWNTFEIPMGFNYFIAAMGVVHLCFDKENWLTYVIGCVCVSGVLMVIYLITKGRAIGGGDIHLMAASGLLLGWQKIILAFCIGCVLGAVIHIIRMKVSKVEHLLAFGPYLSAGILISALWGNDILSWYLSLYVIK